VQVGRAPWRGGGVKSRWILRGTKVGKRQKRPRNQAKPTGKVLEVFKDTGRTGGKKKIKKEQTVG